MIIFITPKNKKTGPINAFLKTKYDETEITIIERITRLIKASKKFFSSSFS